MKIVIYRVISQNPTAAGDFLATLKQYLKKQFRQEEVLIIEREVKLL